MHNPLLGGTLLLTIAGLITRIIGFFYRIFLSNALGARLLGIYQLIFPVYSICYTIFASGIQTAISKLVAEHAGSHTSGADKRYLKNGILLSLTAACAMSLLLFFLGDYIAVNFLKEPECAASLKLLAAAFPFCGITACINGYCYGIRKSFLPATSQLTEQIVRVLALYFIAGIAPVSCELAILALVAGELVSSLYSIFGVRVVRRRLQHTLRSAASAQPFSVPVAAPAASSASLHTRTAVFRLLPDGKAARTLLKLSTPLTANRLLISLLHSFEAFLIPLTLRSYGLTNDEALRIFGILNGMSMSFLMFPGTLTNSLSVLLLPSISEAHAARHQGSLEKSIAVSIKYSVLLGIFSGFYFYYFGPALGTAVFHEPDSGSYLASLSFLCPFLYLSTTLSSILNGFSQVNLTFLSSMLGLSLRILLFSLLIPEHSLYGYFIGLLCSQLFITFFDLFLVRRTAHFSFPATDCIVKPSLIMLGCCSFFLHLYEFLTIRLSLSPLLLLAGISLLLAITALLLFLITGCCRREDFPS